MDQRVQRAAERILDDSSLTDEMYDPEAVRVMEWAVEVARRLAEQTSGMDDTQAQPILDAHLQKFRAVLHHINNLIGSLTTGGASQNQVSQRLAQLVEAASEVPGLEVKSPDKLQASAAEIQTLPPGEALSRIMSHLHKGEPDVQA